MAVIANVQVKFGGVQTVNAMIAPLIDAGWIFSNGAITYDFYKRSSDIGSNKQHTSLEHWEQIGSLLTTKLQQKHTVTVEMHFPKGNFGNHIRFSSLHEMSFIFYGSQPRLASCPRYTSYTPLLESIVCPLANAALPVLEVHCQDDDY